MTEQWQDANSHLVAGVNAMAEAVVVFFSSPDERSSIAESALKHAVNFQAEPEMRRFVSDPDHPENVQIAATAAS